MAFRDQKLVCEQCGKAFFYTVTEQRRLAEELGEDHVVPPRLCPACRQERQPMLVREERAPRQAPRVREPAIERKVSSESTVDEFPLEEEGIEVKLIGTVKWFSLKKGYGFVTMADGQDVFFHRSDVAGRQLSRIREGQQVEFQVRRTDKGQEAFNVSILPTP